MNQRKWRKTAQITKIRGSVTRQSLLSFNTPYSDIHREWNYFLVSGDYCKIHTIFVTSTKLHKGSHKANIWSVSGKLDHIIRDDYRHFGQVIYYITLFPVFNWFTDFNFEIYGTKMHRVRNPVCGLFSVLVLEPIPVKKLHVPIRGQAVSHFHTIVSTWPEHKIHT